ncbi:with coiled-coil, ANK repeat and PH domain-containing protein [Seminavis robusta]|uniref:With coiled-coil, ANK repeat and PH domain-containing protein n=1 Tax=Seminavis robusta TaxID=568900 RepID=A0A9N8EY07_9STRA|nr:with coiled-coil, ANK repeat and PH domain-containing protein [Seminavis robusta]|eukprot:Sro2055_g312770.1 with coiled-coil, ANK repeat and PH domain-containing protein (227) ;mRNA; r:1857-2537
MMWRSKLGNDFDKAMIERSEARNKAEIDRLRLLPENRFCADCGKRGTVWASVNIGVFLCLTCGSHHRSIGTHISKPKGCTGTYLWGPDEIAQMQNIGNKRAAQIYGAASADERPSPNASDATWRKFLVEKYQQKKYAPRLHQKEPEFDFFSHPHPRSAGVSFGGFMKAPRPFQDKDALVLAQGDLLSFHEPNASRGSSWVSLQESSFPKATAKGQQSPDFFAEFGL